ncbi:eukaryotic translation initiation factor 4B isoform X2 [Salmo trutta]|uniref:eukaryotic translation initiation factor 4B isoform X2 n=1 Tax=Salmo trutta TaxID=8032 RepID=UPI0011318168|nr:eukaryotic translation initiation factor 4B-like isoform X2 [Salmo trutta]
MYSLASTIFFRKGWIHRLKCILFPGVSTLHALSQEGLYGGRCREGEGMEPCKHRTLQAKKKGNKKVKTLSLTNFLAEDKGGNAPPSYPPTKPTSSWADETDDLDTEVSTSWHTEEDMYRAPAIDRSILPTAPRSAREPNVDRSRIPPGPPYTAFLGNLPYDVTEDSIKDFFRSVGISAVRLPREPSNPDRLKGFGYAEFDDVESLLSALSLNEENLGNRRIRVDIADQSNDKGRDNHSMGGRDRDRGGDFGPDKTDSDWRAPRPSGGESDDAPSRRDDTFGDRSRDRYESDRPRGDDRYESDRPRGDNRYGGGQDRYRERYDDRDRRDDRGGRFDCRGGGGRRAFGTGYRRNEGGQDSYRQDGYRQDSYRRDDYRGSGDCYGDRGGDRYERREESRCDRGAVERPKLILKPRSLPKEVEQSSATSAPSDRAASIFGGARPVDTAAKEREVEERLKREQEKLQRQLEDRIPDRKPRERHPSWRSEDQPAGRSRTGSESSQPGSRGQSGRASKRRESERSADSGREEEPSSPVTEPSPPRQDSPPLKVVLAPPPKENAWAKRTTLVGGSSEGEARPPSPPAMAHPTAHQLS